MCSHPENTRPLEQKSGEGEIYVALVRGNGEGVRTPPINIPWLSEKKKSSKIYGTYQRRGCSICVKKGLY